MLDEAKVDLNVSYDYKFIVQRIDFTEYRELSTPTEGKDRL